MIKNNKILIVITILLIIMIPRVQASVYDVYGKSDTDNGVGRIDSSINGIKKIHLHKNGQYYNDGITPFTQEVMDSSTTNDQTYYVKHEENTWFSYDISEMKIDLGKRNLHIEGFAYIHNNNNWGGVYSITSIGIGVDGSYPTDFYEVDKYTDQDIFGWHCNWGYAACKDGRNQTHNTDGTFRKSLKTNDILNGQAGTSCYLQTKDVDGTNYGCIYRQVGFKTDFNLQNYMDNYSGKKLNIYIMVSLVKTYSANDYSIDNSLLIGADKPKGNNDYKVYNFNRVSPSAANRYNGQLRSRYIKIGVDAKLCKVLVNGIEKGNCDAGAESGNYHDTNYLGAGYEVKIEKASDKLKIVAEGSICCQKADGQSDTCGNTVPAKTTKLTYAPNLIVSSSALGNWRAATGLRLFYIKDSAGTGFCQGKYLPASWVIQDKELTLTFSGGDTCEPKKKTVNLTCKKPEKSYDIEFDDPNKECNQTFITNNGKVTVRFTQHGVLKIGLSDMKIKSGMGFGLEANYENTVTWEILSPGFVISDSLNSYQKQQEKQNLIKEINKYYKESELFTKSNSKFYYCGTSKNKLVYTYNCPDDKKYYLPGVWKKPTVVDLVPNDVGGTGAHGSKTVTAKYELPNAWSNLDYIWNSSKKNTSPNNQKAHLYQDAQPETDGYINNGRIFFTYLDDDEGYHKISGYVRGLSSLAYENYKDYDNNHFIWQADYNCGIECYQEFYKNTPGIPTSGSNKGFNFSYREINHLEPFPIATGITDINNLKKYYKGIDENWITWANVIGAKETTETNKKEAQRKGLNTIIKRIGDTYNKEPDYVVTVTKPGIKAIKTQEINIAKNNYITYYGYVNNTYSSFLTTPYSGVTITRGSGLNVNEVGTCGVERGTTVSTTTCFCPLTDSAGKCVYNGDIKGAGWE